MDDILTGIHRWMVGISVTLASHHPENPGVFLAGPYMLEVSAAQFAAWKLYLLFRRFTQPHTDAYVEEQGDIFRHSSGHWMQLTHDKRGKVDGAELADPPNKQERHFERQPAGFFKRT